MRRSVTSPISARLIYVFLNNTYYQLKFQKTQNEIHLHIIARGGVERIHAKLHIQTYFCETLNQYIS